MLNRYCLLCGLVVGTFSVDAMVPDETNVRCGRLAFAVAQELQRELEYEKTVRRVVGRLLKAVDALPEAVVKKRGRRKMKSGYSCVDYHCPYLDCQFKTHYLGNVGRHVNAVHKYECKSMSGV